MVIKRKQIIGGLLMEVLSISGYVLGVFMMCELIEVFFQ